MSYCMGNSVSRLISVKVYFWVLKCWFSMKDVIFVYVSLWFVLQTLCPSLFLVMFTICTPFRFIRNTCTDVVVLSVWFYILVLTYISTLTHVIWFEELDRPSIRLYDSNWNYSIHTCFLYVLWLIFHFLRIFNIWSFFFVIFY